MELSRDSPLLDHPPQVGSRSGARALGAGGISATFAVASRPACHSHVSSLRHVERSVPFSGTTLPCLLLVKGYGTYLAVAAFGGLRRTR